MRNRPRMVNRPFAVCSQSEPILIRAPRVSDEPTFLGAVARSYRLHHPWVKAPRTRREFRLYLDKLRGPQHRGFVVIHRASGAIAGVINLSHIIRGPLQSAFVGFYVFAGFDGRGLMTAGLMRVVKYAFNRLRLHRLEANIQPANLRSVLLVQRCGFKREGLARRYLKLGGRWKDHEHWTLLREEIQTPRRAR